MHTTEFALSRVYLEIKCRMDASHLVFLDFLLVSRVLLNELHEESPKPLSHGPPALADLCTLLNGSLQRHLQGETRFSTQQRGRKPRPEDLLTDHLWRDRNRSMSCNGRGEQPLAPSWSRFIISGAIISHIRCACHLKGTGEQNAMVSLTQQPERYKAPIVLNGRPYNGKVEVTKGCVK